MKSVVVLAFVALLGVAFAVQVETAQDSQQKFGYAIDLANFTSASSYSCLRQKGYNYAFVGMYHPKGDGSVLPRAAQNIRNAVAGGFLVQPYFYPQPQGRKTGLQQLDEVIQTLATNNLLVNNLQMWLKVTDPIKWANNPQGNIKFIAEILQAAYRFNINMGIYTNWYDWQQITGNWRLEGHKLWYWNVYGEGVKAESPANFNDFRAFAGFTSADGAMKQFGIGLYNCQAQFNRNLYVAANAKSAAYGVALHQ
uniref:1,4-beta-N-acetylmuramidase n=1 Tax=Steinernema glaseri TaxID=37863 RepID=A0A1I7YJX3_9BILA